MSRGTSIAIVIVIALLIFLIVYYLRHRDEENPRPDKADIVLLLLLLSFGIVVACLCSVPPVVSKQLGTSTLIILPKTIQASPSALLEAGNVNPYKQSPQQLSTSPVQSSVNFEDLFKMLESPSPPRQANAGNVPSTATLTDLINKSM